MMTEESRYLVSQSGLTPSKTDNTQWYQAISNIAFGKVNGLRIKLLSNMNLYVSTTGNDTTGTGTSGSPFATCQKAYLYIVTTYDLNNYGVTVNVSGGTYTAPNFIVGLPMGFGNASFVTFVGNGATGGNPTIMSCTTGPCFAAVSSARISIQAMQVGSTGTAPNYSAIGTTLYADLAGVVGVGTGVVFNTATYSHMNASRGGVVTMNMVGNAYTINGGANVHMTAAEGGSIDNVSTNITITGTQNFPGAFAAAAPGGTISCWTCVFSGTATGPRFSISPGGFINTNGGGVNYFPGSTAGVGAGGTQGYYL